MIKVFHLHVAGPATDRFRRHIILRANAESRKVPFGRVVPIIDETIKHVYRIRFKHANVFRDETCRAFKTQKHRSSTVKYRCKMTIELQRNLPYSACPV